MINALVEDFLTSFDDSRFPGEFLEKYEIIECLAHNENGETLLVKDRRTHEHHVAKCYPRNSIVSQTNESELLNRLHHPGLPTLIGTYQNEGLLCVVREYAGGRPLDKLVWETSLARPQVVDVAVQLCDILTYLHRQAPPVIHRDIKPQNIIVDEQGKVTLIDFGISRAYNGASQEDTACLGTRYYAAPEQYGFSQTDARSDIFSLGILLCWLLTGSVEPGRAIQSIADDRLARIVKKCTAFDPRDRYQNAAQVREALTGRAPRRSLFAFAGLILLVILAAFPGINLIQNKIRLQNSTAFKEPLIEQAVRLSLGKNSTGELTEQDLQQVTEIFVFGGNPAENEETFNVYARKFANNDGTTVRGSIRTLDDLKKLKNLRRVSLVYQNISDLAPLADLTYLENLDLRHNPLADVAPLAQLPSLTTLILFDTNVSDLSVLRSCPRLTLVDAGFTGIKTMAAFDGLDSLQTLVMRKAPLQSLDQIESHPGLEILYLSETHLTDLTPLLALPHLQTVEVDETMRAAAEAVAGQAKFKIVYQ